MVLKNGVRDEISSGMESPIGVGLAVNEAEGKD